MAKQHTAGALDIRNVIGALLTLYGVILLLTRVLGGDEGGEADYSAPVNANLWAGLGLLVVGLGFVAWSRLRPVRVPEHADSPEDLPPPKH